MYYVLEDLKSIQSRIEAGEMLQARTLIDELREKYKNNLPGDEDELGQGSHKFLMDLIQLKMFTLVNDEKSVEMVEKIIQNVKQVLEKMEESGKYSEENNTVDFRVDGKVGRQDQSVATLIEAEDIDESGGSGGFVEDEIVRLQDQLTNLERRLAELEDGS